MRNNLMPLPNDKAAERAVLGCCVLSPEALDTISEILKPEDFYDPNYKIFYELLLDMHSAGKPVDMLTASSAMNDKGIFDRLGGQPFLAELISCVSSTLLAEHYSQIVSEKALRRRFIDIR